MMRRFIVPAGDPRSLAGALADFGESRSAIAEGRVFVGDRRILDPNAAVSAGDEILVASEEPTVAHVALLGRYRGLFAVLKPPGLPSIPDRRGTRSVLHAASRTLGVRAEELHVVTRLDTNVSGIVLVAHGKEATEWAAALQKEHAVARRYVGLSARAPVPPAGMWDRPVGTRLKRRARTERQEKPASTRYQTVRVAPHPTERAALVAFEPITGRTHQIRIHAAEAHAPLLGDAAYGGPARLVLEDGSVLGVPRVALHAARVLVVVRDEAVLSVEAPHPPDLIDLWARLGGASQDFDAAVALPKLDVPSRAWKETPDGR